MYCLKCESKLEIIQKNACYNCDALHHSTETRHHVSHISSYPGCGCWGTVWGRRCPAGWVWPGPPPEPRPRSRPPPPCQHTPTAPSAPAPTPGGEECMKTVRKMMDSIINCENVCQLFLFFSQLFPTLFQYFQSFLQLTISFVGSSVLWEVALTVSGDTPPSCSWPVAASAALSVVLCSLMASLKPEMDTSSVQ